VIRASKILLVISLAISAFSLIPGVPVFLSAGEPFAVMLVPYLWIPNVFLAAIAYRLLKKRAEELKSKGHYLYVSILTFLLLVSISILAIDAIILVWIGQAFIWR